MRRSMKSLVFAPVAANGPQHCRRAGRGIRRPRLAEGREVVAGSSFVERNEALGFGAHLRVHLSAEETALVVKPGAVAGQQFRRDGLGRRLRSRGKLATIAVPVLRKA